MEETYEEEPQIESINFGALRRIIWKEKWIIILIAFILIIIIIIIIIFVIFFILLYLNL